MSSASNRARRQQAQELLEALEKLRNDVVTEGTQTWRQWEASIERRSFCLSARNLACYLALRKRDLRPLQKALSQWGLSSLGRSEAHVVPSLNAVIATLAFIAHPDDPSLPQHPPPHHFQRGDRILRRNVDALFGKSPHPRHVRIMVTFPSEAMDDYALVRELIVRGMDCARINCAHDDESAWGKMIAHVRRAEQETGKSCRVLMDLGGPKARTGAVRLNPDKRRIYKGDPVLLTRGAPLDGQFPEHDIVVQSLLPEAIDYARVGQHVWMDDGKLGTQVEAVLQEGLLLRVIRAEPNGAKIRSEKGLNFPDTDMLLDPLTADDLAALDFVAHHADMIGYSFVQERRDVEHLQKELARRLPQEQARRIGLLAKIETRRAVHNMPDIIVQCAAKNPFGVMIARGDLAVELGFQRLAEMQEQLLWIAEAAHTPVVWATQVLETLVKKGLPSRAEMTDAAMSARADCVMLNKGEFIHDAITLLDDVLMRMQEHQIKKTAQLRALRSWSDY
jgi:pyruvate kinase